MHNTQPWHFHIHDGGLDVLADPARQLHVADPHGWAVRLACGAAIFNARLAFAVAGRPVAVALLPQPDQPDLLACLTPGPPRPPTPRETALYRAIGRRYSNRHPLRAEPVPASSRAELIRAARKEGARLRLLPDQQSLAVVAGLVHTADATLNRDPAYRDELAQWSHRDPHSTDGVALDAAGPGPEPHDLLTMRTFGTGNRRAGRDFESEPLIGILVTAADALHDQLAAGQALEHVLLSATENQLAVSMFSQPIEVPTARDQLRAIVGDTPQMVLRIGYGLPGYPTARRPVADVLDG
ncbi:hypothetical protein Raf01_92650 [Rugosimonospora africana]|uniref:Nitroreductase n=2 Tax=Rugosimonospora africana TaxID=556532 RepID=A0A8J3R260_9ACTN|nr:hypothetical protein Raf01_92650 [Rugosimonospora africana]